jgi:secreted Zn-dependent insulinase-like peptidase
MESLMSARNSRAGLKALWYLFGAMLLASCATTSSVEPQPIKSANDAYQYRLMVLPNKMEVLLISAPDAPKAAASLDVLVGSADSPPDRAGLAHFLEHMLFLGTEKYPDAAEYERFITEHGGSHNAYTSFEDTNFFFDVNAADLPVALDRFAQFFIAPRFEAQYVDREKNAVQAEYQMGLKSDERGGLDVMQEIFNPQHPYSQFSVGSLDTLADRPGSSVRDDLISFYNKYYSANVMRLVVLGSQSLDELEALTRPLFSQVPNRSYQHKEITAPLFEPGRLPLLVQLKPQATEQQLDVSFPIPDYRAQYRVNPGAYLGNLIGHEGEGSLLSQLKAEGLADSLEAGSGLEWSGGGLFSVSIDLTAKGAADPDRVLKLLFAYTDMLRAQGPQRWLYDEQSRLAQLSFRFREPANPVTYVSALASGMQFYAPEDILRGPYMLDQYSAGVLSELLQQVRPDNALVALSSKDAAVDRVSKYYGVPYSQRPLDVAKITAGKDDPAASAMHLPAPNEFIPENVSLVTPATVPAKPQIALRSGRQTIWFMPDNEFKVPRGVIYINFRSPEVDGSALNSARVALFTALLSDQVNEFAYPAELAGMKFEIYKHIQGISLRVNGYNDKQPLLLKRLLDSMAAPKFSQQRFADVRSDMIRTLQNSIAKRPSNQALDDLSEALTYGEWGEQALIEALQHTSQADLDDYIQRFWKNATAEALVYGNYDASEVDKVSALLNTVVSSEPAPPLPDRKVLRLAAGESVRYPVSLQHDDSVVAWYLQGDGDTMRDRGITALTAQIMSSGFFQELRTEQQLGYVVGASYYPRMEIPGLVMLVQSPVADAAKVNAAMHSFMLRVEPALDEEQFQRHKVSLISDILRPDKNLNERAEYYWQAIARKEFDFNGRQQLADAVSKLTLPEWKAYYERVFLKQRHSLEVVAPGRWGKLPKDPAKVFDTAVAIKADHAAYVIP